MVSSPFIVIYCLWSRDTRGTRLVNVEVLPLPGNFDDFEKSFQTLYLYGLKSFWQNHQNNILSCIHRWYVYYATFFCGGRILL